MEFSFDLDGVQQLREELDDLEDRWTTQERWIVGTAVNYAVFLEAGTRHMDPKPFFRPALHAYRSNLRAAIAADSRTTLEEIGSADELVQTIAFGLERRIKRIITKKGLIDTGTLRVSVQAIPGVDGGQLPTVEDIPTDEQGNAIDPRAEASFEVDA